MGLSKYLEMLAVLELPVFEINAQHAHSQCQDLETRIPRTRP